MKEIDYHSLVEFLRQEIANTNDVKERGFEGRENPEFSKGYNCGKNSAYQDVFLKLEKIGVEIKPDLSLIAEAENLISKYPHGFYCGHELNRQLHYYRASFGKQNYCDVVLSEICIRRGIIKARLEAAKFNVDNSQ
jgi:hypothetical protein